ncbi:hypothetical protein ACWENO_14045 [Streptomyces sp. NPDC004436]
MTSKPLPPHGSSARAWGSPGYRERCTCQPCKTKLNQVQKQARYNRQVGRSPFVSPERAVAHLQALRGLMAWRDLATATRIPDANLLAILNGTRTKIRITTERRILAVPLPAAASPGKVVNATGTLRRIQALSRMGHPLRVIAQHAGTNKDVLRKLLHGKQAGVTQSLAARITQAYDLLSQQEPPFNKHTSRARNIATSRGWHLPSAWAEDALDDPDAEPATEMNSRELAAYRRQEIAHLASFGIPEHDIAARLGMSTDYVHDRIRDMRRAA